LAKTTKRKKWGEKTERKEKKNTKGARSGLCGGTPPVKDKRKQKIKGGRKKRTRTFGKRNPNAHWKKEVGRVGTQGKKKRDKSKDQKEIRLSLNRKNARPRLTRRKK